MPQKQHLAVCIQSVSPPAAKKKRCRQFFQLFSHTAQTAGYLLKEGPPLPSPALPPSLPCIVYGMGAEHLASLISLSHWGCWRRDTERERGREGEGEREKEQGWNREDKLNPSTMGWVRIV